ncbi:hypothetical protein Syun_022256 [Stephania yunnanensis]|uniref:Cullin family profile domain-containing protein n=1 Tax=Stephania yunnanensis TaxID=152371 RepID=A0AAP0IH59_9MAGN
MVTIYLRYELLSGRRRYLPIEYTLGALIRVRKYLIVARVRAERLVYRSKPESAGLLPQLNDLLYERLKRRLWLARALRAHASEYQSRYRHRYSRCEDLETIGGKRKVTLVHCSSQHRQILSISTIRGLMVEAVTRDRDKVRVLVKCRDRDRGLVKHRDSDKENMFHMDRERRLNEEMERVSQYLDPLNEAKITNVIEKEMIANHMHKLVHVENSGLVNMLVDDKHEDLGRVPDVFSLIRDVMTSHIRDTGRQLVTDPENSPEFISLFVDEKLRKGLKGYSKEDVEVVLDKVMMLFRYLQEKDAFEKYYKQHLAKHLLSSKTVSDDAEGSLIVKLKTECAYQFTSKLDGTTTDMKTSQDTMQGFHASQATNIGDGPTLVVQVLTTGSW